MKALWRIMALIVRGNRGAFLRGLALAVVVLAMGVALLALSGWFITAAAAAGMIGLGSVFNVFAPSAMVRFLALGRTAARYGERLTTHDATLRALSALRIRLLRGVSRAPYRTLERLRASVVLNRVTADIDALDGLALRLFLPGFAGMIVIAVTSVAISLLVDATIGWIIAIGYGGVPSLVFLLGARWADMPSRRAANGLQALRSRLIDLINVREELAAFGQLCKTHEGVLRAAAYHTQAQAQLDRIDRLTGAILDMTGWAVTALVLAVGARLAVAGQVAPAQAAIGVFAAFALAEAVVPVRRALAEVGQMRAAARRVEPMLEQSEAENGRGDPAEGNLSLEGLQMRRDAQAAPLFAPLNFSVGPGETIALTGPSGSGKSTVLLCVAGQLRPSAGQVRFGDVAAQDAVPEVLSRHVAMVPQRHALVAGSVADNLRLANPAAEEGALWQALEATCLAKTVRRKGGLGARLGFRGAGLSGGEARRLVLARALLRAPRVLLLDEPTEGLESEMAVCVLNGLRAALPQAAIMIAAHRPEEMAFADRIVPISPPNRLACK